FFQILEHVGFPPGVVNFLPGKGEVVGDFLVRSHDVDLVSFTGSKEVGMKIAKRKKRTIAEMGGKNAIIIDETANLDKAIEGAVLSAFGYQGQKCSACSRILIQESRFEEFQEGLVEAVKKIEVGPVIDEGAIRKISRYISIGKKEGRLVIQGRAPKGKRFVP